jgi:hypothetical protein
MKKFSNMFSTEKTKSVEKMCAKREEVKQRDIEAAKVFSKMGFKQIIGRYCP